MKNKIIGIGLCLLLVASALPSIGSLWTIDEHNFFDMINSSEKSQQICQSFCFVSPTITEEEEFCSISYAIADAYTQVAGQPRLPRVRQSFELPFGATDIAIMLENVETDSSTVAKPIKPAQDSMPLTMKQSDLCAIGNKDISIYESNALFPSSWYTSIAGCGLNQHRERVTHLSILFNPVRYNPVQETLATLKSCDIKITYTLSSHTATSFQDEYSLLIIAPEIFADDLQPLVAHKNDYGISTVLKTTEEIYREYTGVDNPEKIKYCIKDAIETWNTQYVLLVGGLKSFFIGEPRDDQNQGDDSWYVPVRYSNLYDNYQDDPTFDPGFLSDLYYADIYKQGGVFDSWDSNGDGIFAARNRPDTQDDTVDLYPDVYLGRLPCRNNKEVQTMAEKIIAYESVSADPSWFNRILTVAGDGLQDQKDLDIQWDTTNLEAGEYTIYAQSKSHITNEWGPIDEVIITIDKTSESSLSFSEEDQNKITSYPGPAIAEITSPSNNDILGNTDVDFLPPEAYMGYYWANVSYIDGVMHIRGKSYDPRPYGALTDIKVWIKNSIGDTVFTAQKNDTAVYFDCEWVTGNRQLGGGRAGGAYYMPTEFERRLLWASNGNFTGMQDVIDAFSEGCGFAFFFGHAAPNTMIVNLPGMPGGFSNSGIIGLQPINLGIPVLPMDKLANGNKLPIVTVLGCHNSQFNITFFKSLFDWRNNKKTWTYGFPTLECWSWWLTKVPDGGAIATIGCTGLGYGSLDENLNPDTGCWIFPEFYRQYGQEGHQILGDAHGQSIVSYINTFGYDDMIDVKTAQEYTLFGDPSLKIGGY